MRDSKRDADVQNRLLDSVGEGEEEGGMIWENGIETCIISYKKRIASLCLMQDTGCLWLVHIQGYHYHPSKFHIYVLVYCIGVFLSGLLHCV